MLIVEDEYKCLICNKKNKLQKVATIYGWNYFCEDCINKHVFFCNSCNTYYYEEHFDRINLDDEKNMCKSICGICFENDYFRCTHCCKIQKISSECDLNSYVCEKCINNYSSLKKDNNFLINHSRFIPQLKFYKYDQEETELFIGVELELAGKHENYINFLKEIHNNTKFVYCKRDGSLPNYGVEIVSHPATINFHNNSSEWIKIFDLINKYEINNTNNCGLHFHFSKKYFSDDNIKFLDYFINNNEKIMKEIGGRSLKNYCSIRKKLFDQWGTRFCSNHCDAINITNKNTIEIRFCASTYEYDIFRQRMNDVFNIIMFSKQYSFEDILKGNNAEMFEHFLK